MKLARLLVLPLLGIALAAPASAQDDASLDGLWFKLKVTAKGYAVEVQPVPAKKSTGKLTAFLHLIVAPAIVDGQPIETSYEYQIWNETTPGHWEPTISGEIAIVQTDGSRYFLPDLEVNLQSAPADVVLGSSCTLGIKVKRNDAGDVVSATIADLGGDVSGGANEDGFLFADLSIKGKTIAEADLPFTVN